MKKNFALFFNIISILQNIIFPFEKQLFIFI